MARTYLQMQDSVLKSLALYGNADARAEVKLFINAAARDAWNKFAWNFRRKSAFVNTVAPYATGTVTVTKNSATVTGSGTTFTAAMVGRKFSLGYSKPWYKIGAYVSATEVTLDRVYLEASGAAQTYKVYNDIVALASDVDVPLQHEFVVFKDGGDDPLTWLPSQDFHSVGVMPDSEGTPTTYRLYDESGGLTRIQVWPVPDDAYGMRYSYLKTFTEMSANSDVSGLPAEFDYIIQIGALRDGYRLSGEFEKGIVEEKRFDMTLQTAWEREESLHPRSVIRRPFDAPTQEKRAKGFYRIDYP